jgi:organic hydroperoxide reductase OsmC/OhrA
MSEHTISLEWSRDTPDFTYDTYSRNHAISFGTVGKVCGSAAPEFHGDPRCIDPEQAFVVALASCHMLTFLAIACKKGFIVDKYSDKAIGELGKNQIGKMAMIKVELRPEVVFSGTKIPTDEEFSMLHDRAHSGCIITNSIANCVEVIVSPTLRDRRQAVTTDNQKQ